MPENPTEWDIEGGNFNKPIQFPETIKDSDAKIDWSYANEPDLQIRDEFLEKIKEEDKMEPIVPKEYTQALNSISIPIQGKKKSKRINPDSLVVLGVAVALVTVLMASSFTVSFSGIYEVSAWTGLPGFLQWLPAFFIDAAILAYTISLVVFSARGESRWRTMLGLGAFAALSVVANIAHTISFWQGSLADPRAWIGVLITGAAPIAVLLASEEITRLAFEKE
jgi:hypothetical protein